MSKTWLTSDDHFGHERIITYCSRPYFSVEEMNEALTANWNSVVSPQDRVIFLGDFSMGGKEFLRLNDLNFDKLVFVYGNHDRLKDLRRYLDNELSHLKSKVFIEEEITLDIKGHLFHCIHQPIRGSDELPVLCGHVHIEYTFLPPGTYIKEHSRGQTHLNKVTKTPILNVGVDMHAYKPISEDQVLEFFKGYL